MKDHKEKAFVHDDPNKAANNIAHAVHNRHENDNKYRNPHHGFGSHIPAANAPKPTITEKPLKHGTRHNAASPAIHFESQSDSSREQPAPSSHLGHPEPLKKDSSHSAKYNLASGSNAIYEIKSPALSSTASTNVSGSGASSATNSAKPSHADDKKKVQVASKASGSVPSSSPSHSVLLKPSKKVNEKPWPSLQNTMSQLEAEANKHRFSKLVSVSQPNPVDMSSLEEQIRQVIAMQKPQPIRDEKVKLLPFPKESVAHRPPAGFAFQNLASTRKPIVVSTSRPASQSNHKTHSNYKLASAASQARPLFLEPPKVQPLLIRAIPATHAVQGAQHSQQSQQQQQQHQKQVKHPLQQTHQVHLTHPHQTLASPPQLNIVSMVHDKNNDKASTSAKAVRKPLFGVGMAGMGLSVYEQLLSSAGKGIRTVLGPAMPQRLVPQALLGRGLFPKHLPSNSSPPKLVLVPNAATVANKINLIKAHNLVSAVTPVIRAQSQQQSAFTTSTRPPMTFTPVTRPTKATDVTTSRSTSQLHDDPEELMTSDTKFRVVSFASPSLETKPTPSAAPFNKSDAATISTVGAEKDKSDGTHSSPLASSQSLMQQLLHQLRQESSRKSNEVAQKGIEASNATLPLKAEQMSSAQATSQANKQDDKSGGSSQSQAGFSQPVISFKNIVSVLKNSAVPNFSKNFWIAKDPFAG